MFSHRRGSQFERRRREDRSCARKKSKCAIDEPWCLSYSEIAGYEAYEMIAKGEVDIYVKLAFLRIEFHFFNLNGDGQARVSCEKLTLGRIFYFVLHFVWLR